MRSLLSSHGNFILFLSLSHSANAHTVNSMWIWAPTPSNHNKPIIAYALVARWVKHLVPSNLLWLNHDKCVSDDEIGLKFNFHFELVRLFVCSFTFFHFSGCSQVHCVSNSHFARSKHQVHVDITIQKRREVKRTPSHRNYRKLLNLMGTDCEVYNWERNFDVHFSSIEMGWMCKLTNY